MVRALIAGAVLAAAAGPTGRWFLVPLALVVALRAFQDASWKERAFRGWLIGAVMFGVSLAWTRQFSLMGWPVLVAYQAVFFAIAAALTPQRKDGIWRSAFCFIAAFTLLEIIRIRFPLGGLPLGGFTTSASDSPFAWTAEVAGETAIVTVLASVAVGISEVLRLRNRAGCLVGIPLGLMVILGFLTTISSVSPAGSLHVVTVQAGGPQALKINQQDPERVFNDHYRLTEELGQSPGFIVWPEDVIDVEVPIAESTEGRRMSELARNSSAFIGAGVVETEAGNRFRNAYVVWAPNGAIVSRYEKVQRVPFGEYVPLRGAIDSVADLSQVPADAIAGTGPSTITFGEHTAAVGISYEGLFGRIVRSGVQRGGEFVVIPTNAASYKSPRVARTQVQSARFRAIETGRDVVQSAPTGISAFVGADGEVRAQSQVGRPEILDFGVNLAHGQTLFTRFGNYPLALISGALLLLMWGARFVHRERDRDPAGDAQTESC